MVVLNQKQACQCCSAGCISVKRNKGITFTMCPKICLLSCLKAVIFLALFSYFSKVSFHLMWDGEFARLDLLSKSCLLIFYISHFRGEKAAADGQTEAEQRLFSYF